MSKGNKFNHHYIPRFYLKYWANEKKNVWIQEKNPAYEYRKDPYLLHIDKVCSEFCLFSIGDSDAIEDWIGGDIETHCAPVFHKVTQFQEVNEDDLFYLKTFLALTMARHPLLKKSSEKLIQFSSQEIEFLNPLAQTLRLRLKVNLIEINRLQLQILYISPEIKLSFITSDVPFVIVWDVVKDDVIGLNRPTINSAWFPISPKALAFLSNNTNLSLYEKVTDLNRIKNINLEIGLCAKNILIANSLKVLSELSL